MNAGMSNDLTLDELSARTGESPEELRRWCKLGLLGPRMDGTFCGVDVEAVRLIQLLVRRGIGLEAIAAAEQRTSSLLELVRVFAAPQRYSAGARHS